MQLDEYQLATYQPAAVQAVYAMGGDPYEQVEMPDGLYRPAWVNVAAKMCELRTMLDLMRQHGLL